MESFGELLRKYRLRCRDPLTDGKLTQSRLGELLGNYLGGAVYSYAAVSDWELNKSKIHADDRRLLVGLVNSLKDCGGLTDVEEANRLLHAGNYRALDQFEARQVFPELVEGPLPVGEDTADPPPVMMPLNPETRLTAERKNQLILLNKVRNFWSHGVLEQSIQDAKLIDLARQRCDEAVEYPLRELVGPGVYDVRNEASPTLSQLLKDADNALLILGEPGSGKTTTLLQLTEELCDAAERDTNQPIPVVLNLVSWAEKRGSIASWIVADLTAKYQIPGRLGRAWLGDDALVLLLDGFDEVPARYWAECAEEINSFRETHGLTKIVVCSRTVAYRECGVRLRMGGATQLCPFTDEQVDTYLEAAGDELVGLRSAIKQSSVLQEMARSPLMLRVMCSAYENVSADSLLEPEGIGTSLESHQHLFSTYVTRMFGRRGREDKFSSAKTRGWLSWLAGEMNRHSQSVFLIEQLQPSWLPSRGWRWVYLLTTWFFNGLYGGIVMWLLTLLLQTVVIGWPASEFGFILATNVVLGLAVGVAHGMIFERRPGSEEDAKRRGRPGHRQLVPVGLIAFSLTVLFFLPSYSPLLAFSWALGEAVMFVIISRYSHGRTFNTEIRTVEALTWSWPSAAKGLGYGLLLGVASEIVETWLFGYNGVLNTVFTFGTAGLILGGLRGTRVEAKNRPNEGIRLSLRNAVGAGLFTALSMILVTWVASKNLERALFTGLMLGIFALLLFGLSNAGKHYLVRLILWYNRRIPWRLTQLLDYSSRLILLRKVGGGYMYVHRMLQSYFMVVAE